MPCIKLMITNQPVTSNGNNYAVFPSIGGRVRNDGPTSSRPSNDMADYELPSYDDIVDDDLEEPVMDENERIARQEEEDARIAKELFEKEQKASQAEVNVIASFSLNI